MRKIFTFLCAALMSVSMFADINLTITQKPTENYSPGDDWVELSMHSEEGVDVTLYLAGITEMALGTSYNLGDMDSWSKISISGTDYELSDALITKTMNDGLVRYAGFVADYNSNRYNFDYQEQPAPEPAEVTVVFAANNKTVERTVTLPHTFKCDWAAGMDEPDELDIIIHELYNDYYYCNSNMNASGSDQVEVGTEEDPQNDYITIKGVFEGTATVTGDYFDWITGEEGAHNYSITISIKGDETAVDNIQIDKAQSTKLIRNGMLLIEKNGKIYNLTGAQVR